MKRYHLTFLKSIFVWAVTALFFALPVAAQGNTVEVKVRQAGDVLLVETTTRAGEPGLRLNPDPAYLELSFPGSALQGAPFSKPIDKGLVQKVVTSQEDGKALTKIYVLNKPKTKLTKTASGYVYEINLREMANAPSRTAQTPAQPNSPAQPTASAPTVKPTSNSPSQATATPAQPKPQGKRAPVTAKFQNTPLKDALTQMAAQAGMKAEIDPQLVGTANADFDKIPMEEAVAQLLKPIAPDLETSVTDSALTVKRKKPATTGSTAAKPNTATTGSTAAKPNTGAADPGASTGKPATATPATAATATATASPTVVATAAPAQAQIVREYFPFQKRNAEKALDAARLAFPGLTYAVDSELNVLLVEGPAADVAELEKFLRAQSPK